MSSGRPPAHLIDADAASSLFRDRGLDVVSARPDYVRHKPGETTVISYVFETANGDIERGYVHWCADRRRADQIHRKARTLRPTPNPIGGATQRIDDHTVLYPFPNDARLRRLRWYTTARKLKRTLGRLAPDGGPISGSRTTVRILRYKPERRVVVDADLRTSRGEGRRVLVRYTTARGADALAGAAAALRAHGVGTPEPLAQLEHRQVSVDEFIDGVDLRDAVRTGQAAAAPIAEAIGDFHATPLGVPTRSARADLEAALAGLEGLASWNPQLAGWTRATARELARSVPGDTTPHVLIHGDLHDKNVMVTPDGGVAFVDLERVARGPAASDLGRLRGIVRGLSIRQPGWSPGALDHIDAVIEEYRRRHPGRLTDSSLAWHTATALVDQALLVARHLERDWPGTAALLLDEAIAETIVLPVA